MKDDLFLAEARAILQVAGEPEGTEADFGSLGENLAWRAVNKGAGKFELEVFVWHEMTETTCKVKLANPNHGSLAGARSEVGRLMKIVKGSNMHQ